MRFFCRERKTGRWTESQLQYINTLHLFTVQLLLGKVEDVDAKSNAAVPSPVVCNEEGKTGNIERRRGKREVARQILMSIGFARELVALVRKAQ